MESQEEKCLKELIQGLFLFEHNFVKEKTLVELLSFISIEYHRSLNERVCFVSPKEFEAFKKMAQKC